MLPNMLIVGAQKCGTTTLVDMLRQHPEVHFPRRKELHFFDTSRFTNGLEWYGGHFRPTPGQHIVAEATPSYCYDSVARRRLTSTLPRAKLVAILRDPVERAHSHYWHERRVGREDAETFEEALALEPERLATRGRVAAREVAYVDRGRYVAQLRRLARLQGRERLHVLFLDDLVAEPRATMSSLATYLDIDPGIAGAIEPVRSNPYRVRGARRDQARPVRYPPMSSETRRSLLERFRVPNRRLARWLGRDLPPGWQV